MQLPSYLRVIRKGWLVIFAMLVLGTAAGVGLTAVSPRVYQSSVQIFVATAQPDQTQLASGNVFAQDRVQSYITIANSPVVVNNTIKALNLTVSENELEKRITADAPQSKVLINLHVTDSDPNQAARIAAEVGAQFKTFIQATDQVGTSSAVNLTIVRPANIPRQPIKPRRSINIGLGALVGLAIGLGIAFARDTLDNTVKSPQDFETLGVPVLGLVPYDKRTSKTPVAFRGDPHSARSEAYRAIRTNMQFVDVDNPPHMIAITSAMPGEGKTITAINLASALAEAGYRVCLIDADLRRPSIAHTLGLVGDVGFTTVLISDTPVEEVLQNAGRNLAVLTSGPVPPNPSELLISAHARRVIKDIASKVDYTIIDTPPLLPVTDGAELATIADATLIVARAGKTTVEQSQRAVGALDKVGEKPVGVILNMITSGRGGSENQYGYYYAPYRPERKSHRVEVERSGSGGSGRSDVVEAEPASRTVAEPAGRTVAEPPPEPARTSRNGSRHSSGNGSAATAR